MLFSGETSSGGATEALVRHVGRVDWVTEGSRTCHLRSLELGKRIVHSQTTGRWAWLDYREPERLAGEITFPSRDLEFFFRKMKQKKHTKKP